MDEKISKLDYILKNRLTNEEENRLIEVWRERAYSLFRNEDDFLRINYFNKFSIDSFDWFLGEGLPKMLSNQIIRLDSSKSSVNIGKQVYKLLKFGKNITVRSPTLWPNQARKMKETYEVKVFVDCFVQNEDGNLITIPNIEFCKIPVMVGSKFCKLRKEIDGTLEEKKKKLIEVGECSDDPMGYFIVNGNEMALVIQDFLQKNYAYCIISSDKVMTCFMNSQGTDFSQSRVDCYVSKTNTLKAKAPFINQNYIKSAKIVGINAIIYWRLAIILKQRAHHGRFYSNPDKKGNDPILKETETHEMAVEEFTETIRNVLGDKIFKKALPIINSTKKEMLPYMKNDEFWRYILEIGNSKKEKGFVTTSNYYMEMYMRTFLPHCSTDDPFYTTYIKFRESLAKSEDDEEFLEEAEFYYNKMSKELSLKLVTLANMFAKLLYVKFGYIPLDNRDAYMNKKFECVGDLMISRTEALFRDFIREISTDITTNIQALAVKIKKFGDKHITRGFDYNFTSTNWNNRQAKKVRPGATEVLDRQTSISSLSMMRKISTKSDSHSKATEHRNLVPKSLGFSCPAENPEGKKCGLVAYLSLAAWVTNNGTNSEHLMKFIKMMKNVYFFEEKSDKHDTPSYYNGLFLGYCDGHETKTHLVEMRRKRVINKFVGVNLFRKKVPEGFISWLYINSWGGRIAMPLLIVKKRNEMVEFFKKVLSDEDYDVYKMMNDGWVEYIDMIEVDNLVICESMEEFLEQFSVGKEDYYTHIFLDPSFILGISANMMVYSHTNPPVRNSYFSSMVKQPIAVPISSFSSRAKKSFDILQYPQKPIVQTAIYDKILDPNVSFGYNVKIMVAAFVGNTEDGIILNEDSVHLLGSNSYSTVHMDFSNIKLGYDRKYLENVKDPSRFGRGVIRKSKQYLKRHIKAKKKEDADRVRFLDLVLRENKTNKEFMEIFDMQMKYGFEIPEGQVEQNGNLIPAAQAELEELVEEKVVLVDEPVKVEKNDILITEEKATNQKMKYQKLVYEELRGGTVEDIIWDSGSKKINAYVVIKKDDTVFNVGDKMSSRHGQKGVVARILPADEMPYEVNSGERPDIIVNPMSFPSRMTVGQLIEIQVGNIVTLPDKNKNLKTLFYEFGFDCLLPLTRIFLVPKDENLMKDRGTILEAYRKESSDIAEFDENVELHIVSIEDIADIDKLMKYHYNDRFRLQDDNGVWGIFKHEKVYTLESQNYKKIFYHFSDVDLGDFESVKIDLPRIERIPGIDFHLNLPARGIVASSLPKEIRDQFLSKRIASHEIFEYKEEFFRPKIFHERFKFDFVVGDRKFSEFSDEEKKIWMSENRNQQINRKLILDLPVKAMNIYMQRSKRIKKFRDGTIFRKQSISDMEDELELMGYERNSTFKFVDGKTGKDIEGDVFYGTAFYVALDHKVKNKIQSRGEGWKDIRTRAAVKGKKKEGGLKFSESEVYVVRQSGATRFLQEKLLKQGDIQNLYLCKKCGERCYIQKETSQIDCPICKGQSDPVQVSIPFSTMKIQALMATAGVKMRFDLETSESANTFTVERKDEGLQEF